MINESYRFNDLSDDEKINIYNIFKQSYENATGTSWDYNKFNSRAYNWMFFGDNEGFITIRPQESGYYKLTGTAGNIKSIMKGLQELQGTGYPIWGMMTKDMANIMIKRYGFKSPNRFQSILIKKLIPSNVFGNVDYKVNSDGSMTFNYPDVGTSTKVFVGNDAYYQKLKSSIKDKMSLKNFFNETEQVLDERRAVDSYVEDTFEEVKKYIDNSDIKNTYVSFRKSIHTGYINRNNEYDTPTGVYCYPMENFIKKFEDVDNIDDFRKIFPYTPDSKYIYLFTLKNTSNIVYSLTADQTITNYYVDKINQQYGSRYPEVSKLCAEFKSNSFNFHSDDFNTHNFRNEFQRLWLFIYQVVMAMKNTSRMKTVVSNYTLLCDSIRLYGFVDNGCNGIIHPNEPCQAVFFTKFRNIISGEKIIELYSKRGDAPLNIDSSGNGEFNNNEAIYRFEAFLAKNGRFNSVKIIDTRNLLRKIKNNIAFMIEADYKYLYINKEGKPNLNGVRYNDGDDEIHKAAYFNTLNGSNYRSVENFNGAGIAVAETSDNRTILINKAGLPADLSQIDVNDIDSSSMRASIINTKFGTNFNYVDYFNDNGIALATNNNGKGLYINKEGKPDVTGINVDEIDNYALRTDYINEKYETNYKKVYKYNEFGIAMAILSEESVNIPININKEGQPDNGKLNFNDIYNSTKRAAYFNTLYGTKYVSVYDFEDNSLAIAKNFDGTLLYINKEGKPDVTGLNPDYINGQMQKAAYINTLHGTNLDSVYDFNYGPNNNIARAILVNSIPIFINKEGQRDVTGIDYNELGSKSEKTAYINSLHDTNYTNIDDFNDNGIAFAKKSNDIPVLINKEGQPDIGNETLDNIVNSTRRAGYVNTRYGTEFYRVLEFNENNIAIATKENGIHIFINSEGKPDATGINFNEIYDGKERAGYINTINGTNWAYVYPFKNGVADAETISGQSYEINMKGEVVNKLSENKVVEIINDEILKFL